MLSRAIAIFWNADSRRLRLPWRIVLFAGTLAFFTLPLAAIGGTQALLLAGVGGLAARMPVVLAQGIITIVAIGTAAILFDRRPVADYGLHLDRRWCFDFGFGFGLGALLMTGIFLTAYTFGWARVTGVAVADVGGFLPSFTLVIIAFLVVGLYEELLARGYLLVNLAEGLQVGRVGSREATTLAAAGSAVVFGFVHLTNPNATLAAAAGITVAGLFLAASYVLTGELALPAGIHAAWNLFQGGVYGLPVSGIDAGVALFATRLSGPPLATGGQFGPEAGLLGVAASVVGTLVVVAYAGWEPDPRVWTPEFRWDDESGKPTVNETNGIEK